MPTYPYYCPKCDKPFEVVQSIGEAGKKRIVCPTCKARKVERLYSGFFAKTSKKS